MHEEIVGIRTNASNTRRTCATWSTCVGTDTGGSWQLISTGVGGRTFRVPWRVRRRERNCSPFECWSSACCLGTITSFRQMVTCLELRCKVQLPLPCDRRVELISHQGSFGQNDLATSSGGCQLSATRWFYALNQRTGGWESPSHTSVWSANEGLWRTDGTRKVVFHWNVVDERDQLARRFIIQASAREVLERHVASEAIRRIDFRGFDETSHSKLLV